MKLRIFIEPQHGASYDDQLRVARAAEDLGFDAFFRSDHYLTMGHFDGLPGPSDSWITLAGLARETERIRLGTLVNSATFRRPGPLAISVAQVDQMSGGRVELGLGTGWYEAEHRAYGIPFPPIKERFDRLAEQVEVLDGLWRTPVGATYSFAGAYYQLTDSPALPKPAQNPPPLILGGAAKPRSAALAARFAAEYNVGFSGLSDTEAAIGRVAAAVAAADRDPASITYSTAQAVCVGRDNAELARRAEAIGQSVDGVRSGGWAGTPAEIVDTMSSFAAAGISTAYLQILDLTDLDHLELIATEVARQL